MKKTICLALLAAFISYTHAQQITPTPEQVKTLTSKWTGERFADGRPKTSDRLLERLKNVSLEEAWGYLRNKGYQNQF